MHWDDPEGWYGEGGGRRVQDGEHMYNFFKIKKRKKKEKQNNQKMSGYKLLYKKLNKNTEYQNFSPNMKKHFCCFVVVLVKPRHINLLRK